MGGAVPVAERLPHPQHRPAEIARLASPARRVDARVAADRRDDEAGIVTERGEEAALGPRPGLERGVGLEGVAGLLGLGKAELGGADRLDAIGREQHGELVELAGIVGGDQQLPGHQRPSAVRCCRVNSAMPARARSSMRANSESSNGAPSAVAWISTIPPLPVITKLASVSAVESSA